MSAIAWPPTSPRLALTPEEAAAALSMSRDTFDRYVRDELRLVRVGRKVLVPVRELERWLDRSAARTMGDGTR
ncbi:MAG TPA: helix-turn-helix domain-containing protein [Gaiellaceae bacterium]|jgi:excisionase family DNA binding protein